MPESGQRLLISHVSGFPLRMANSAVPSESVQKIVDRLRPHLSDTAVEHYEALLLNLAEMPAHPMCVPLSSRFPSVRPAELVPLVVHARPTRPRLQLDQAEQIEARRLDLVQTTIPQVCLFRSGLRNRQEC